MPNTKYSNKDANYLPFNIMDLRDEAFYDFIRQFFGKRLAELLAFQECNGVDSYLGCKDVTAVLYLKSDQLTDLKKHMCITSSDGSIHILPGLESSIINLTKVLKKKREETHKQAQRLQSITSPSAIPASTITTSISFRSTAKSTPPPPIYVDASVPGHAPASPDSIDSIQSDSSIVSDLLTDELRDKITRPIIDWLIKMKHELSLIDASFQEGIDFQVELNNRRDGVIVRCRCGTKNTIGQKKGILVVRQWLKVLFLI